MAWLRPAGMRLLAIVLWWPWLSPVVPVGLLALAGRLGGGWLVWTEIGVGLLVLAVLVGLVFLGVDARRVSTAPGAPAGELVPNVGQPGSDDQTGQGNPRIHG